MSNALHDGRPAQRDGSFSDVLMDDQHPLHPKTAFPERDEFDEEALRRAAERVVSMLAARPAPGMKFPAEVVVARLQELKLEVDGALAKLGALEDSPASQSLKLLAAIERLLRWIWADGKKAPFDVFCRLLGITWLTFPNVTGASSQVELLRFLKMKDKQQFNRYVTDAREHLGGYYNGLMRGAQAVENMHQAATERAAKAKAAAKLKEAHVAG